MPDYYVRSLRLNHVVGDVLFQLPSSVVNILSRFGFQNVSGKIRMNPVALVLTFHRMTEANCASPRGPDEFLAYDFSTGVVRGYRAEKLALVK